MPFGAGSDMMKSFKSNRKQLTKKRSLKESYNGFKDVNDLDSPNFKKVSKEELAEFKRTYLIKKKKEDRKNLLVAASVFLVIGILFYVFLFTM